MKTAQILKMMKIKAEAKATEMKDLELSIWSAKHESDLKKDFGFTDKTLAERKLLLSK